MIDDTEHEEEEKDDLDMEDASDAEYVDLPDGGAFIFPRGAGWAADELGASCFRIWPNGNLSYLIVPEEGNPRWKVVEHKKQGLEIVQK